MEQNVKAVNRYFKNALRVEVDALIEAICPTDRQRKIIDLKYKRGMDINFIADELGVSSQVVNRELKTVRKKMARVLGF